MAILLWAAWAALLIFVAWCARLYLDALRMDHLTATIPGPPRLPFIGNALDVILPLDGMMDAARSWIADCGYLFKLWVGPSLFVFVLDAEDIETVMTSPSTSSKPDMGYFSLDGMLGKGLLVINGKDYKRHRKLIATSMHSDVLQEFLGPFNTQCRELQRRLDPLAETGELVDVKHHIGRLTAITVIHTVIGTPGLDGDPETTARIIDEASQSALMRFSRPWFRFKTLFWLSSSYGHYYALADWFSSFAEKVIAQKIQTVQHTHRSVAAAPQHRTFVDTALSSNPGVLSRDELRDEIKTMTLAGITTSMDFLTAFLLCMSLSPKVQRRVQQELDDVFGWGEDRDIEFTDLPHLKYLDCALKETLRLFSPAPIMGRKCTDDVQLPSGKVIPKGCNVALLPILTHRNPRYFSDPERFDPDRFLPERSQDLHPHAFIPFSGGTRSCPGQRYGMLFAKTVAASLLRRYDVLPDAAGPQRVEDVKVVAGISLSIKGGVRVELHRRQHA